MPRCLAAYALVGTPAELFSIATASCDTVASLTGWDVRSALLSHSTDNELEAMAAGDRCVLDGAEEPNSYTGMPVFTGFPVLDDPDAGGDTESIAA